MCAPQTPHRQSGAYDPKKHGDPPGQCGDPHGQLKVPPSGVGTPIGNVGTPPGQSGVCTPKKCVDTPGQCEDPPGRVGCAPLGNVRTPPGRCGHPKERGHPHAQTPPHSGHGEGRRNLVTCGRIGVPCGVKAVLGLIRRVCGAQSDPSDSGCPLMGWHHLGGSGTLRATRDPPSLIPPSAPFLKGDKIPHGI